MLVRVHAAGVNPGVWRLMTGLPQLIRVMGFGMRGCVEPALAPQGTLVIVGGEGGGRWFGGMDRQLRALMLAPFVGQRLCSLFSMRRPEEDLQLLKELVEAGKITPVIDRIYPLSEVRAAIRHLEEGH